MVKETVRRIRAIDQRRLILVGGNIYNAADELQNIEILEDPDILYTFHYYLPMTVTHQKAPWVPALVEYDQQVDYPGQSASGLETIVKKYPDYRLDREVGIRFDKTYLHKVLQPAMDFSLQNGQPVYCGEFGVYEKASMDTRLNWTRDLVDLLNQFHIGRTCWTYKALDFGLVDKDGAVVNKELIEIVSKRS